MVRLSGLAALVAMGCSSVVTAMEWNTFDGPGKYFCLVNAFSFFL